MEAAVTFVGGALEVRERLSRFVEEVTAPFQLRRQRENALLYVRGLVEHGGRKSLQPTLFRLEETAARYESMQQFLADSPWDPESLVRGCAERVAPEIGVVAWVVDDTGVVKDGKHSPGVKRQYSGTLGQGRQLPDRGQRARRRRARHAAVGLAALSARGVVRRQRAAAESEDPGRGRFQTKPALAAGLCERAAGWLVPAAPVLGDAAYGDDTALPHRPARLGLEYVLAVRAGTSVYGPETIFAVRERHGRSGRPPTVARPDRKPESARSLAERLPASAWTTLPCRTSPAGEEIESRFAFVRLVATHPVRNDHQPPRAEWLIIEWPEHEDAPSDYWLSNLPEDTPPERLARLARLRWTIELDYRQLKGELGLDHYEGRSYLGFHHHTALVTCAHAFLTLERLDPKAPQPA